MRHILFWIILLFVIGCSTPERLSGDETQGVEVLAVGLEIPWEIAFLPDGSVLVTERPGVVNEILPNKSVMQIEGVQHVGEAGLLGMAVHPNFLENKWIYLYLTTKVQNSFVNRVERYRFDERKLLDRTVVLDNIPAAAYHDGGRIAFGPDGLLYVTTGDATDADRAQDTQSLAGKILRVREDGSIPMENPFGNAVFSYGHRNVQGLAWDAEERLWATEHGRSGLQSGLDEVNLIEAGKNYGWPVIEGDAVKEGMVAPVVHSGPDVTWAPAAAAVVGNRLFFTGLRGEKLYEFMITDGKLAQKREHFVGQFGRLRALRIGPDGLFYMATSNTDGRGDVHKDDDKILRFNPVILDRSV